MEPGELEAQGSSITQSALMLRTCGRKGSTDCCFTYDVAPADLWTAFVFTKFTTMVLQRSWVPPHESRFEFAPIGCRYDALVGKARSSSTAVAWLNLPQSFLGGADRMFWTWNNSNSSDFLQSLYIFLSLVLFNHSFFLFLNGYRLFVLTFSFDTFSSQNLPLSNFWHFFFKLNFFARIFSDGLWGYRVAAVHAETWQQVRLWDGNETLGPETMKKMKRQCDNVLHWCCMQQD